MPEKWKIPQIKYVTIEEKDTQLREEEFLNQDIYCEVMLDFLFEKQVQQNQDINCEEESPELLFGMSRRQIYAALIQIFMQ